MITYCKKCQAQNPKYRCSSCKQVAYCSAECQKTDWKEHKPECNYIPKVNEIKTVVVNGMNAEANKIPVSELDNGKWEKCQVPTMLGVPVMVRVVDIPPKKPQNELAIFLMVDPVSGLAAPKWQQRVGRVEFARCDKKDLDVQTFWDLYSYIYHLMDYYGEMDNYEKFRDSHLVPKAYIRYRDKEHQIQRQFQGRA